MRVVQQERDGKVGMEEGVVRAEEREGAEVVMGCRPDVGNLYPENCSHFCVYQVTNVYSDK